MELASLIVSILSLAVSIIALVLAIRKQVADWQRARERCSALVKHNNSNIRRCQMTDIIQDISIILLAITSIINAMKISRLRKMIKDNQNA